MNPSEEQAFSPFVIEQLKYYVYTYSDPRTGKVFHAGKGKGNRVFSHLKELRERQKTEQLQELESLGLAPDIAILIHGLSKESLPPNVSDLKELEQMVSRQSRGEGASFGRMSIDQIKGHYEPERCDIEEPSLLIRINRAYRDNMPAGELYEYTRGRWKIDVERAKKAKYGFAVYQGIIREVYEISEWHRAGETSEERLEQEGIIGTDDPALHRRYEFTGSVAPNDIRSKYLLKSVRHEFNKGSANPIKYKNA
jgi:hypothetical protein